jgi:hypothetical protein
MESKKDDDKKDAKPRILELRAQKMRHNAIVEILNSEGYTVRGGKPWTKAAVQMACSRARKEKGDSSQDQTSQESQESQDSVAEQTDINELATCEPC